MKKVSKTVYIISFFVFESLTKNDIFIEVFASVTDGDFSDKDKYPFDKIFEERDFINK